MQPNSSSRGVYRSACFLVGAILFLITLGGQVTTRVAGMAVPDWPGTFGQNMFLYPWSSMTRSMYVFLEHSHRLVASGVGLITLVVTFLVFLTQPKGWARRLAVAASVLVACQGLFPAGAPFFKLRKKFQRKIIWEKPSPIAAKVIN